MEERFKEGILKNLNDTYYVINVESYIIEDTNDSSALNLSCHKHFHQQDKDCTSQGKLCPMLALRSQKDRISNGIYNNEGKLTHIIRFKSQVDSFQKTCLGIKLNHDDWKNIFDSISSPTFILDTEYNIIYANEASNKLGENFAESVISNKCHKIMHNADEPPEGCPYEKCLTEGCVSQNKMLVEAFESVYTITCTPIFDNEGKVDKIIHLAQDVTDQEISRKKIVESEYKYRQLFNNHISGFALHEIILNDQGTPIDYKFLEINPAFERMTGLKARDIIGKTVKEILPGTEDYWINSYGKVAIEGKSTIIENHSVDLGKHFEVNVYSPKRGQFATIFNDITKRKEAVQALIDSEDRLNSIIEQAPYAIYVSDFNGKIITTNNKASLDTGYSNAELSLMSITDIDYNSRSLDELQILWNSLTINNTTTLQTRHRRKNGSVFPAEVRIGLIIFNGKKHIIGFANNISEQKKTIEELAIHNERLESLYRISQYVFDTTTEFLDFVLNEAIKLTSSKIGYLYFYNEETKEFTLNSWSNSVLKECEVIEKQTQYKLEETGLWGEAVRQRKPILVNDYSEIHPHKKGTPAGHVQLKSFLTIPFIVNGKIEAVIGVANKETDYVNTDIKQLQILMDGTWRILEKQELFNELIIAKEQAEESNELKTAFLANISHEIRTPMNAILGFTELLNIDNYTKEERSHYISIIKQSGEQLLKVINDIIDIAKLSAGVIVPEKQICNVYKIISDSIAIIRQQQYLKLKKHIDISINWKDEFANISIISDQVRIQQIFTNLISNAVKYTHEGSVEIGVLEPKNGFVTYYVKDTGVGIPEDQKKKIFELFRQLQADSNIEGTGIGLNITQGLVKLLGGEIWVESELEKGSTFYFSLPYIVTEQAYVSRENIPQKSKNYNWSEKTIYIAEDEQVSYQFLEIILLETGVNLKHAQNGEELISFLKEEVPDLILLDINMPKLNGKEAIKWIRENNYTVPVIAQTAYSLPEDISYLLEIGCTSHVAKPINQVQLFTEIKKYLFV